MPLDARWRRAQFRTVRCGAIWRRIRGCSSTRVRDWESGGRGLRRLGDDVASQIPQLQRWNAPRERQIKQCGVDGQAIPVDGPVNDGKCDDVGALPDDAVV